MPTNQFIHDVIYALKMDFGTPADIYKILASDVDPESGKRAQQRKRIPLMHVVMLPSVLSAAFKYALSFIASNKNFVYGGNYEKKDRFLILDANDLPDGTIIDDNDYVVLYEEKGAVRYEIKEVQRFETGFGYLLTVQETAGMVPYQILEISVSSYFDLKQRVHHE
jgi:hypothetical protein